MKTLEISCCKAFNKLTDTLPEGLTSLLTMMGIQNCDGGKAAGVALSYEQLESKYRYQIKLSKAMDAMEEVNESKKTKGLAMIQDFLTTQTVDASTDTLTENLVKFVNADLRKRSLNINPWIADESFWDMEDETYDIHLNKTGALELLKIEKREEAKNLFSQPIRETIQKMMESQFSGTNALMNELTGEDNVEQGSHQGIYLKNLIGHIVGVSQGVMFDRHTGVLYDNLIEKSRDDVLALFFKHVTPEVMANEVVRVLNDAPIETKKTLLNLFLPTIPIGTKKTKPF